MKLAELHPLLEKLHVAIRTAVVQACEQQSLERVADVAEEADDDTIYAIDRVSEAVLVDFFAREVAPFVPLVLIAEGLPGGQVVLPAGTAEETAVYRIIMDPIDGTRGLMYQKRSAWILTAVAPNRGPATSLQDIEFALQTEIPLIKQHLCDSVWAMRGQGVTASRTNRLTGQSEPLHLRPSTATTIAHGFATIVRFFPGIREIASILDEEITQAVLGPIQPGKAMCFEDQYICTGGQLYELMAGHDRFVADIRPLLEPWLARKGQALGITCHPYDICTELIARELGVVVVDGNGHSLDIPLNTTTPVTWVGYANPALQTLLQPALQAALRRHTLL